MATDPVPTKKWACPFANRDTLPHITFKYLLKQKSLSTKVERLLINMAATYSPAFWCSTMGHEGLNFSVRNGKR